jgi:hypothetical protein
MEWQLAQKESRATRPIFIDSHGSDKPFRCGNRLAASTIKSISSDALASFPDPRLLTAAGHHIKYTGTHWFCKERRP